MNLSASLNFTVTFDLTGTPKVVLTDTSLYPSGVADSVKLIWDIRQPDTVWKRARWVDALPANSSFEAPLRLNSAQLVQQGTYMVTLKVDHPDYDPTEKTITFDFRYTRKAISLNESFDVFVPKLLYQDLTNYEQGNYSLFDLSRNWNAQIGTVGTVTGTASVLDLAYGGLYYDARYTISFSATLLYTHQEDTFLSVRDQYTKTITTSADTPKTMAELLQYLISQKATLDSYRLNPYRYEQVKARYDHAEALYSQIKEMLCRFETEDLNDLIDEFIRVTHNDQHLLYVNTNQIIPPYDYQTPCGPPPGTGGGGTGWEVADYTITSAQASFDTGLAGAVIKSVFLDGIKRRGQVGTSETIPATGQFVWESATGLLYYGTDSDTYTQPGQNLTIFYIPAAS